MKTKFILALLIAAFSFMGVSTSNAAEVRKVKTSNTKSLFIPGPEGKQRVYQQGRHRWHRMNRRHAHERVRRHQARHARHRESRHARHHRRHY